VLLTQDDRSWSRSHSDLCTQAQGSPTTNKRRPSLVGLKIQSDAHIEMESRVNYFSSLLNFIEMGRSTSNLKGKSLRITFYKKRTVLERHG